MSDGIQAQLATIAQTDRAASADRFEVNANLDLDSIGDRDFAYLVGCDGRN
jgi:hypothetical protein